MSGPADRRATPSPAAGPRAAGPPATEPSATNDGDRSIDVAISVVIPMRNAAQTVARQVESLLEQDCPEPWELIIVDNGSDDGSAAVAWRVVRTHPWPAGLADVRIVNFVDRHGYASPRNHGASESSGALLAFCDADDHVAPGWLGALVDAVRSSAGLVGSRIVPLEATEETPSVEVVDTSGPAPGPTMHGVPVVHTGGVCFTRELFDRLGGFDEYFDSGGEDGDISMRAHLLGVAPVIASGAVYFARGRASSRGSFRQAYRNGRTQVRLYERHHAAFDLPPAPLSLAVRRITGLVRKSPRLLREGTRQQYLAEVGATTSRLLWSARLRVRVF